MRTCEVLVLNFRLSSQENFRVFDFAIGFDSRLATGCAMNPRPRICSYLLSSMVRCGASRGISSNGRAAALHAAGKGIDAPILHSPQQHHGDECVACRVRMFVGRSGDVAQMVERVLSMHEAMGSMPIFSTRFLFTRKHPFGLLHWVRSPACDACVLPPL